MTAISNYNSLIYPDVSARPVTWIMAKGLVLADALESGEDLYVLFAGILIMRYWNRVIDLAVDRLAIQSELQIYASYTFLKSQNFCINYLVSSFDCLVPYSS